MTTSTRSVSNPLPHQAGGDCAAGRVRSVTGGGLTDETITTVARTTGLAGEPSLPGRSDEGRQIASLHPTGAVIRSLVCSTPIQRKVAHAVSATRQMSTRAGQARPAHTLPVGGTRQKGVVLGLRGMKLMNSHRVRNEAHRFRDTFNAAMADNVIDLNEARRLRELMVDRLMPEVEYNAAAEAYGHAIGRGAATPEYLDQMAVLLRARLEAPPEPAA